MNKNITKLIADISEKCVQNKINFRLEYANQVDTGNIPCSGFFDEESLVVATKKKNTQDWLDILVHESCHLDQFVEKSPFWFPDELGLHIVENWIKNKKIKLEKAKKAFLNSITLELDCEKRTVKKLKKYKIKFDVDLYTQKANAYLFGYGVSFKKKIWPSKPYEKFSLYSKMPKKFLKAEEYFNIPDNFLYLYKYSYEKNSKTKRS
jgi:hypothetical protein